MNHDKSDTDHFRLYKILMKLTIIKHIDSL